MPSNPVPGAPDAKKGDVTVVIDDVKLQALLKGASGPLAAAVLKKARNVERGAKRYAPVDTGRLQSSITSSVGEDDGELVGIVGTDVEYAAHVEFGTVNQPAQSFLRRALDDEMRKMGP